MASRASLPRYTWSAPRVLGEVPEPDSGAQGIGPKGDLELDSESGVDPAISLQLLRALPGLAEATAQRIALRGLGQPDSFPAADMRLRRLLAKGDSAPLAASVLHVGRNAGSLGAATQRCCSENPPNPPASDAIGIEANLGALRRPVAARSSGSPLGLP